MAVSGEIDTSGALGRQRAKRVRIAEVARMNDHLAAQVALALILLVGAGLFLKSLTSAHHFGQFHGGNQPSQP